MQRAGHLADVLGCSIALADIRITQGRLREAMRTYEQALQLDPRARRAGAARNGRHVRRHERAPPRTQRSRTRPAAAGAERGAGRAHRVAAEPVSLAGRDGPVSAEAEGDLDEAVDLLDEAERVYVGDFLPNVRPVPAVRARAWIAQGQGGRRPRLGAQTRAVRRGRAQLPARVRARHPGQGAAGAARCDRAHPRRGNRAAGASPPGRRGGTPDGQRHRDPGAAGARPPDARGRSRLPWWRWNAP